MYQHMQLSVKQNTSAENAVLIFNTVAEGISGYKRGIRERSTGFACIETGTSYICKS
jgi:hypothetical protein